jgi:sugar/nucleoside kinase (ribokinase family)
MKRQKIVTFGELLLRFSKPGQLRLTQGDMFTSKYGGSEANVAVSLATLGEDVTYITRLPDTPVGHAGAQCLAQLGVDISQVLYGAPGRQQRIDRSRQYISRFENTNAARRMADIYAQLAQP